MITFLAIIGGIAAAVVGIVVVLLVVWAVVVQLNGGFDG